MIRKMFFLILLGILQIGCSDPLQDDFFEPLFGLENIDISYKCSDNRLSPGGQGQAYETYEISVEALRKFKETIYINKRIPLSSEYSRRFDSVLHWTRTPINNEDISNLLNSTELSYENKCFDKQRLINLLNSPGNFCASYYSNHTTGHFYLFILSEENRMLYVIQNS